MEGFNFNPTIGYTPPSQIFEQKRDCSQRLLCFEISDGRKTARGSRGSQVLQYGKTILQKPEEETQDQTIVITPTSQIISKLYSPRNASA